MAIATTNDWDEVTERELDLYEQEAATYRICQFVDDSGNVKDPSSWTIELKVYDLYAYEDAPTETYTLSAGDLQVDGSNYVAWNLTDAQTDSLGTSGSNPARYSYALRVDDGSNTPYFAQKGLLKVHSVSE